MSEDIYEAWNNLGKEKILHLLRRLADEVDDTTNEIAVRMWLAQQTGLRPEQIPDDNIR